MSAEGEAVGVGLEGPNIHSDFLPRTLKSSLPKEEIARKRKVSIDIGKTPSSNNHISHTHKS